MESRDKRDLPEVVAEILIEQHAMREDIAALRHEMKEQIGGLREDVGGLRDEVGNLRRDLQTGLDNFAQTFNGMTNAILNAMNRGNDRYDSTGQQIKQLDARVTKLENPTNDAQL
jgi:chromosome segregation ATPase